MRHAILFLLGAFLIETAAAQQTLRIEVNDFGKSKPMFLTGTINNWNPGDPRYQLKRINSFRSEITLHDLSPGQYEFKLTGGTLEGVESTAGGDDIPNRVVDLKRDTTVLFTVRGWKDDRNNPARFSDSARLKYALGKGFRYLNTNLDSSSSNMPWRRSSYHQK